MPWVTARSSAGTYASRSAMSSPLRLTSIAADRSGTPAPLSGVGLSSSEVIAALLVGLERAELRVVAHKAEARYVRGPVAVLGDVDDHDAFGVLVARLVDEDHEVGVLFDRARLAQVGELGLLFGTRLDFAVELGDSEHRHVELAGELLERARDVGDLLLAVVGPPVAHHELQIVDD